MGRLPVAYLKHTISVAAFTNPGYATAVDVRCLVDYRGPRMTADPNVGQETQGRATIYAPLATTCPAGSRVTLPDGRVGIASAVIAHSGGGLATPDHLEIEWRAAYTSAQVNEFA